MDRMSSSKSPNVLGLVSMIPATSSSSTAWSASTSTQPRRSLGTVTTSKPPSVTDAGLVPWAESGMITLCRVCPLASNQARMSSSPVSSPAAPAAGCRVAAAMPVISHSAASSSTRSSSHPWMQLVGSGGVDVGQSREHGHRVADLGVVLHRARAQRVRAEIDGELAVAEAGEVADQVTLGHLGQLDGAGAAMGVGDELLDRELGDTRGAELPGAAPRFGELEQGGLGVAAEQRRAGGPTARGRRRDEIVDHHRTAFSNVDTKASISARVRRSVTATRSPSVRPPV